jgi:hypothetical protein
MIRHWGEDGGLAKLTLLLGCFAKTVHASPPTSALARSSTDPAPAGDAQLHMYREISPVWRSNPDLLYTDARA